MSRSRTTRRRDDSDDGNGALVAGTIILGLLALNEYHRRVATEVEAMTFRDAFEAEQKERMRGLQEKTALRHDNASLQREKDALLRENEELRRRAQPETTK
jgi:hypothetical protein